MQAIALRMKRWPGEQPQLFLMLAALAWFALYQGLLPVERDSHLGGALQFFFYDTPKVLLLLTGVVFVMGVIHTFVSPERTRALLSGKHPGAGNVVSAGIRLVGYVFNLVL